METELLFYVNDDHETDVASFLGYKAVEKDMLTDAYIGSIPTVTRVEYIYPLAMPVPPQLSVDDAKQNSTSTRGVRPLVSPWTIGACVATIVGGLISIGLWTRRNRGQRRHVPLIETSPVSI